MCEGWRWQLGENRDDEIWVGEEEEQETSADIGGDVNCQERKEGKEEGRLMEKWKGGWGLGHMLSML